MGKYDCEMNTEADSISGKIMSRISRGAEVLEFGCAEGRMTRYMKSELDCRVSVVELDRESFESAMRYAADGFCGDIDSGEWKEHFHGRRFDFILFADVLEHLRDPEAALISAAELLKDDGEVFVSIPNIAHNDVIAKLFLNRFEYTDIGLLDSTHIHFWGIENLQNLARSTGYAISVIDGAYQEAYSTEQEADAEKVPAEVRALLEARPYNEVYQVFMVLRKAHRAKEHNITTLNLLKKANSSAALFWDFGEGYSAQHMTVVEAERTEGRALRFASEVPHGCLRVRFDPTENRGCAAAGVKAYADGTECAVYPLNGTMLGDAAVFTTHDPQMEFAVAEGTQRVEITAEIYRLTDSELRSLEKAAKNCAAAQVNAEERERECRELRESLKTAVDKQTMLLEKYENDIHYLIVEKKEMEAADNELRENYRALDESYRTLSEEHEALRDRYSVLETDCRRQTERGDMLSEKKSEFELKLDEINSENRRLSESGSQLKAELDALREQYAAIADAQCWKMTAPLRKALDTMKRTKPGFYAHKTMRYVRVFGLKETAVKAYGFIKKKAMRKKAGRAVSLTGGDAALSVQQMVDECRAGGGQVYGEEILLGNVGMESVLLISHELDLTGAPIVLGYFAECLQRQGKLPVMLAPRDDKLRAQLVEKGIPIMVYPMLYESDFAARYAPMFELTVINTNVGAPIVSQLSGTDVQVLWWIHEAHVSYYAEAVAKMPETLGENIHVYCVSDHAERVMKKYRPAYRADHLMFCLPDYADGTAERTPYRLDGADGRTVFVNIGTFEQRKGQDIMAQAVRLLTPGQRAAAMFVFVGRKVYAPVNEAVDSLVRDFPDCVRYIPELSRRDILGLYSVADCAVCSSRDEPVSIIVAEALSLSKTVICSENAGAARFLTEGNSGFVYRNNDPQELADNIVKVLSRPVELEEMRKRARRTYERHFTREIFERNIDEIFDSIIIGSAPKCSVSVVIPTYNAGDEFAALLTQLKNQRGIKKLELVIVDSGSRDDTVKTAEEYGATVIRISQKEFSHSYARNLGMKNAHEEYVMVMTQDAVPNGSYWLWKMSRPLVNDGAAAVSCRETPKPGCDLLGRLSIYIHSEYMGILTHDRILSMPESTDFNSIRKNAQLNDVACMFNRRVFGKFKYRGDYAEDLDIGMRMIEAGYSLALMSSVCVVHSHTRPAYYHMKRGVVDVFTLSRMLHGFPTHTAGSRTCINRIVTAYIAQKMYVSRLADCGREFGTQETFAQWTEQSFGQIRHALSEMTAEEVCAAIGEITPYTDENVQKFILDIFEKSRDGFTADCTALIDQAGFLTSSVAGFVFRESGMIGEKERAEICGCVEKHFGQLAGAMLAGYMLHHGGESALLDTWCGELKKGV